MKRMILLTIFLNVTSLSFAQETDIRQNYIKVYSELEQMIRGEVPVSFKRAVFITENAYLDNKLSYDYYLGQLNELVTLCEKVANEAELDYSQKDRDKVLLSWAIFRVMKEPMVFESPFKSLNLQKKPYDYDMEDFWGEKDWTKMFVNKLLNTQSGNCHSLPALYKILADELGVEAWLSVAPSHTYIKQWSEKMGWYNTELTTGRFPIDSDIKWNSYISTESIAAGVYMDTLSAKETIAYVITDFANGYIKKFGYTELAAPIRWLEEALVYYPDYTNALILRAELLKKNFEEVMTKQGEKDFLKAQKSPAIKEQFSQLEKAYVQIHQMGYRRMPKEMYLNWLFKVQKDTTRKPYQFASPQPFKQYNYNVQIITAGDGQNYEFFDQEEIVRIGTVELNRVTGKIIRFVNLKEDEMPEGIVSRMYDPALGRWWSVDPLTDKYHSMSPYTAMANNPIRYNDPTGMEFTEAAMAWVNRLIADIDRRQSNNNDKIADKQAKIDGGDISDRKANRLNRQIGRLQANNQALEGVRGEIGTMAASSQVYNVVERDINENGAVPGTGTNVAMTSFNSQTGAVDITMSANNSLGQFSHELKHGYQFEVGQISLGEAGSTGGRAFLLDKHDEVEAYQRQALFGTREAGAGGVNSLPDRYKSLPIGPVDVTTHPQIQNAQSNQDPRAIPLILQRLSGYYNQAYRVNGTTYRP